MIFKSAKTSCNGDYVTVNASNEQCVLDMDSISKVRGITSLTIILHVMIIFTKIEK